MLRKGDSIGVFQLEGGPMRTLMRALAPTSFDTSPPRGPVPAGAHAANMHFDYADRKNGRKPGPASTPTWRALGDTHG